MRKTIPAVSAVSVVIGIGIGMLLPSSDDSVKPAVASAAEVATLPVDCRSALLAGSEALGGALSGLGQAQSALVNSGPSASPSAALGVVGQSSARVQGLLQQYNQSAAACRAATTAQVTP